ncbi:MAG TPA: lysine biosynthesis protein LysX [Chloroflexota bacterium]|jgi:[lysine-biosynthesis-protein LysW]--L-2-aminoadipate ligase|nr:lysine biosynthesis protein LysX [Chloroflexota bacterium]
MKLGILISQVRLEEKLIFAAAEARGLRVEKIFDRDLILDLENPAFAEVDLVLDRSLVHSRAEYTLRYLESAAIPTVNSYRATITCDNKFLTTTVLFEAGIPTLPTLVAYTPDAALKAIETIGYPAVLKPPVGSWGRLLAKINDRDAAEAVLEHKEILGSYHHSIYYIQKYIEKKGGDIRAFVVGDRVIGASYRSSDHWITNVARGATTSICEVTPAIEEIALRAAHAVQGEILGVDLVDTPDGYRVIEINTGAEFKGLQGAVEGAGIDVPGEIVDYLLRQKS